MDKYLIELKQKLTEIHNTIKYDEIPQTPPTPVIDKFGYDFIKSKSIDFIKIFIEMLQENKKNITHLKHFITTELNNYYKNRCKNNITLYKSYSSLQQYILNLLSQYEEKEKIIATFQEIKQQEYTDEIFKTLTEDKRAFAKAPTGFGKTVLYYKNIKKMNHKSVLMLTPRLLLNEQIVDMKYMKHLNDNENDENKYKIIHFSNSKNKKIKKNKMKQIKRLHNDKDKFILTACYQSKDKLLKYIKKFKIKFDIIIFDEAHTIETWENSEFITNNTICTYRLFGSATPTEKIGSKENIYGKIIEKVKIFELIINKILCPISTIVKKIDGDKKEYHDLPKLIVDSMVEQKKRKGIIFVNEQKNAEKLYELMKIQDKIKIYIYISDDNDLIPEHNKSIIEFGNNINPSIVIVVDRINYGYDNSDIDFICLADSRESDVGIRQIVGRGLRWNKKTYPNKMLHVLIPLYKEEFSNTYKYSCYIKYLDYIKSECGYDIIVKDDKAMIVNKHEHDEHIKNIVNVNYDGDLIPTEIFHEYCTIGNNMYSNFMSFLANAKVYDESTYINMRNDAILKNEKMKDEIPLLENIHKKFPQFCFQVLHPQKSQYYLTRIDAQKACDKINNEFMNGKNKNLFGKLTNIDIMKKIREKDNKIPTIRFKYYYLYEKK